MITYFKAICWHCKVLFFCFIYPFTKSTGEYIRKGYKLKCSLYYLIHLSNIHVIQHNLTFIQISVVHQLRVKEKQMTVIWPTCRVCTPGILGRFHQVVHHGCHVLQYLFTVKGSKSCHFYAQVMVHILIFVKRML